jgi:hypothetical protein
LTRAQFGVPATGQACGLQQSIGFNEDLLALVGRLCADVGWCRDVTRLLVPVLLLCLPVHVGLLACASELVQLDGRTARYEAGHASIGMVLR